MGAAGVGSVEAPVATSRALTPGPAPFLGKGVFTDPVDWFCGLRVSATLPAVASLLWNEQGCLEPHGPRRGLSHMWQFGCYTPHHRWPVAAVLDGRAGCPHPHTHSPGGWPQGPRSSLRAERQVRQAPPDAPARPASAPSSGRSSRRRRVETSGVYSNVAQFTLNFFLSISLGVWPLNGAGH